MRAVVRFVAGLVFLAALLTTLEALRRLALDLLVHGSTPSRIALFSALAAVGVLGLAGSVSLARLREAGRKRALAYLIAVTPVLFFLPEEPTLRGLVPFSMAVGCAFFLCAPHVRQLCASEPGVVVVASGDDVRPQI